MTGLTEWGDMLMDLELALTDIGRWPQKSCERFVLRSGAVTRLCIVRGLVLTLIGLAACCTVTPARADSSGFVPSYSGSQVMLYVSWSFAARGSAAQAFGVRYERSSPVVNNPAARFCAPLAHRSLVDLQFARGAGPRMQFGPRVTWDISRGRLSPTVLLSSAALTTLSPGSGAMPSSVPAIPAPR